MFLTNKTKELLENAGNMKIFPIEIFKHILKIDNSHGKDSPVTKLNTNKVKTLNRLISGVIDSEDQDKIQIIVFKDEDTWFICNRYYNENRWDIYTFKNKLSALKPMSTSEINKIIKNRDPDIWYIGTDENAVSLRQQRKEPITDKNFQTKWDYISREYITSYKADPELIQKVLNKTLSSYEFRLKVQINTFVSFFVSDDGFENTYSTDYRYNQLLRKINNYNRIKKGYSNTKTVEELKELVDELDKLFT